MIKSLLYICLLTVSLSHAQLSYPPDADTEGTTAISKSSTVFVAWATGVEVERGYIQISDPTVTHMGSNKASYGSPSDAIGEPDIAVVSLGDGGIAIVTFEKPITNGEGYDFAVFENGSNTFLELAFVEVSSDGANFFRFPAHSETQTDTSIGGFGSIDARNLNNLAGKYKADYGTPFDLDDVPDNLLLDKSKITHVKLIDVVGSLETEYATVDSFGNKINDPYPTPFYSGGFDLAGVGVINQGVLSTDGVNALQFTVYPNPANELLSVNLGNLDTANVTLYDTSGRIVLVNKLSGSGDINVSSLSAGIYHLEISTESIRSIKQIVIK
ncbi:hypothetical protein D3C87_244430 [compost metagenome]